MKLIFVCLVFLSLVFLYFSFGEFDFQRTWTTAICEENRCRDFEVTCLGEEVLEMKPITGFVVFGEDWVDKREDQELC